MDKDPATEKTAFRAGRMAGLLGHRKCPYADTNRAKAMSWRCGWIDGDAERLSQRATANERAALGTI